MLKLIFIILFLFPSLTFSAQGYKTRYNSFTGKMDFVIDVSSIEAGNLTATGTISGVTIIQSGVQVGSGGGAPTDADYLIGTANVSLSAEIVVGTTPGGSLGGTWASPTIDDLFLLNSASDVMTGTLIADGLTLGADENITLGGSTIKFETSRNDFIFGNDVIIEDQSSPSVWLRATDDNNMFGLHYHINDNYGLGFYYATHTNGQTTLGNGGFPIWSIKPSTLEFRFPNNNVSIEKDLIVNGRILGTQKHILQGSLGTGDYDTDPDVWLIDLDADVFPNGIYITKVYVDCNEADPTTELTANLNYCDAVANGAFPGATATLIKAIGTTTGNFADNAVNTTVATGKSLYITITADPTSDTTIFHVRIHYYIPTA